MRYGKWLRGACGLIGMGIALGANLALLAGNDLSAAEPPRTKQAAPAAEPMAPQKTAEPKSAKGEQDGPRIPKYHLGAELKPVPAALDERLGLEGEGLLIGRVARGSPADKAGIKPDDIVLAVGDQPIKRQEDLIGALNSSEGKELSLNLLRDGKTSTVAVTPQEFRGRVVVPKYRLGAALAPVPAALDEQLNLQGAGLLIERVAIDGPAQKAGIKQHDILLAIGDQPIKQYIDMVEATNASDGKVSLTLLRDGETITVTVMLTKHRRGDEKILVP
jgi:S1-C subfamily serine protease